MSGPLQGVRIVEMSGLGPAPFACMMLADLGAEVICVDRLSAADAHGPVEADIFRRGKRTMALDLKQPSALQAVLQLIDSADVVVEEPDGYTHDFSQVDSDETLDGVVERALAWIAAQPPQGS